MNQIPLSDEDRKALVTSMRRIVGQMHAVTEKIEGDKVSDQTFTQLLAIKGGVARVCKDIISRGILTQMNTYTPEELDQALAIILKLDN